jgi:Raf kinase inhibitor-like YbhB/YbcL family protein
MKGIFIAFFGIILIVACFGYALEGGAIMELKSPEFKNNEYMPKKFTCLGANVNPALIINGIPDKTKSIALICDDPDAPNGNWVHWVVFDMPVISKIEEDSVPGKQGINDFGKIRYDGPCPPFGTHRYFFKVYALDTELNLEEGLSKADLEEAMDGHILAKAELIGLFKR